MTFKHLILLLSSAFFFSHSFSQHVDEGAFNDWDFAPHGVYGNLPLSKVAGREYYKIEKINAQTVRVQTINPSGVVTKTMLVLFMNAVINKVQTINQWGETYEYENFTQLNENEFKVTDMLRGVNNLLPCKYVKFIYKDELLTEKQYYSYNGRLTKNKEGAAIIRYKKYDDKIRFGEVREMSMFDEQGQAVISESLLCHKIVNEYDDHDNKISISYLGLHDEPIKPWKGNVVSLRYSYDNENRKTQIEFLGADKKQTSNIFGIASAEFEYDQGYMTREKRFDSLHKPTRSLASGDSVSIITYEYDNNGNKIKEAYFDETGSPISNHSKVHEIRYTYSASNMLSESSFFNEFELPSEGRDNIHAIRLMKDNEGRIIQRSIYNLNGSPILSFSEKVFIIRYKYDDLGRINSISYWRDSVTMMPAWFGACEQRMKFNDEGGVTEYDYFNAFGMPVISKEGSSKVSLKYGTDGRLYERRYIDHDSLIIRRKGVTSGYSIIQYSYGENGRAKELTFFDNKNQPVNALVWIKDSFRAHKIEFVYNGPRIIKQLYYLDNSTTPFQTTDCLTNDFIAANGISIGRRNEESTPTPPYSFSN